MQLPSRQEIRVRNLFNVVDCKLHWQKNGDYLCVKVDRTPKGTQVCHLLNISMQWLVVAEPVVRIKALGRYDLLLVPVLLLVSFVGKQ